MKHCNVQGNSKRDELLERAKTGDKVAFGLMCQHSRRNWLNAIVRMFPVHLRTKLDPEDLLQDVLAIAWRKIPMLTVVDTERFDRWILTISRNQMTDAVRRFDRKKRKAGREDQHQRSPNSIAFADCETPSKPVMRRERLAKIEELLDDLSHAQREVVVHRILNEHSCKDVAAMIGKTQNNVDVTLHRALRSLHKAIRKRGIASTNFRLLT